MPDGAALRNPETGSLLGNSPFMESLVFLIVLAFLATGIAYGIGANAIASNSTRLAEFMFRLRQAMLASGEQTAKVELLLRRMVVARR